MELCYCGSEVEHHLGKEAVTGSNPVIGLKSHAIYRYFRKILIYILKTLKIGIQIGIQISKKFANYACMAQQVAHSLGKVAVTGSNPVIGLKSHTIYRYFRKF